jgi:hypothetical protein
MGLGKNSTNPLTPMRGVFNLEDVEGFPEMDTDVSLDLDDKAVNFDFDIVHAEEMIAGDILHFDTVAQVPHRHQGDFFALAESYSLDELLPDIEEYDAASVPSVSSSCGGPVRKRRKKVPVPDHLKDEKYWERRRKNTAAARRNRELKRLQQAEKKDRLPALESRNRELVDELVLLEQELILLRQAARAAAERAQIV